MLMSCQSSHQTLLSPKGDGGGGGGVPLTDLAAGVPHPILLILTLFRTTAYRFLELFSDLDSSNPLSWKEIWVFDSIIIVSCIRSF